MGSFTSFLEDALLDHVFNGATYIAPSTLYLAFATADPTDAATGASMNEVPNSGSYARAAISFGAASSRTVTQDANVDFPQLTGDIGTATHWAITDSDTYGAGNVLAHGTLVASKGLFNGNSPSVLSGQVVVSFEAGEISTYLADELLDHAFNNSAYTAPGTAWVALATASISDTTTGSNIGEPSGGSYARAQVNVNGGAAPTWDLASSSTVTNAGTINFATATAPWGTVTGVAVLDASTNGNVLFYDNAQADQSVGSGDLWRYNPGALNIVLN